MMWGPRIPVGFWLEVVRNAAYLKNRSPYRVLGITPCEMWFKKKLNLNPLQIFGCHCYTHLEDENRKKWDSHILEGLFMGYLPHDGIYAVYNVNKRTIVKKRDVTFFEHILGHPSMKGWGLAPG